MHGNLPGRVCAAVRYLGLISSATFGDVQVVPRWVVREPLEVDRIIRAKTFTHAFGPLFPLLVGDVVSAEVERPVVVVRRAGGMLGAVISRGYDRARQPERPRLFGDHAHGRNQIAIHPAKPRAGFDAHAQLARQSGTVDRSIWSGEQCAAFER